MRLLQLLPQKIHLKGGLNKGVDYSVAGNVKKISQSMGQVDEAAKQVLLSVTGELSAHATQKVEALLGKMGVFMEELKKIA